RDGGGTLLVDNSGLGMLVGHHDGRVGKHLPVGDVIGVVVAIDEVFDGLGEAFVQFSLEPLRRLSVNRICRDDADRRHRENSVVVVVLEPIEVSGNWRDLAYWRGGRLCLHPRPRRGGEEQDHDKNQTQHCPILHWYVCPYLPGSELFL